MWDINATPKVCILLVYNTLNYYVYTFYAGCKDLECQDIIYLLIVNLLMSKVVTTAMKILDSAADQFQHTVNLWLSKPLCTFSFKKVFK